MKSYLVRLAYLPGFTFEDGTAPSKWILGHTIQVDATDDRAAMEAGIEACGEFERFAGLKRVKTRNSAKAA